MAAGNTYTPLATTTFASATTSYTFSSISGSYTDLILVINAGTASNNQDYELQFNSDTATNYSCTFIRGNGTAADSGRSSSISQIYIANSSSTTLGADTVIVQLQNYSNTTTYKTVLARANVPANAVQAIVGLWRSTAAISTIKVACPVNMSIGTTMTLYGIAAA